MLDTVCGADHVNRMGQK